jgi:flagellar motor switch protein FliM
MGDILSQSEIDALLSALSSGQLPIEEQNKEEKVKVKKYNFKMHNKFSKEHIKTLQMVHDNFARIISNYLSAHLRTSTQAKVISIEQTIFEEFIHSIPNPTILTTFYLKPFEGIMLFESGPQYVFQIVDLMFGGEGKSSYRSREFTEIEKNIIKRINTKMLEHLKIAWEDIMDVDFSFDSLETNPALNQVMAPKEPVVLITLSVEIGYNQCYLNMCIPYFAIEKFLDKLMIRYKGQVSTKDDTLNRNTMKKNLYPVEVDCHVELGRATITVEEFLSLSVGDWLTLDNKLQEPLELYIKDSTHSLVYPGTHGNKLAVQVAEILYKDVKDYD